MALCSASKASKAGAYTSFSFSPVYENSPISPSGVSAASASPQPSGKAAPAAQQSRSLLYVAQPRVQVARASVLPHLRLGNHSVPTQHGSGTVQPSGKARPGAQHSFSEGH